MIMMMLYWAHFSLPAIQMDLSDKRPFCNLEVLGIYASLLGIQISYTVNGFLMRNELSKG